jgi:hypothetical protein
MKFCCFGCFCFFFFYLLRFLQAELEAALIAAETGILSSSKGKDEALTDMAQSIGRLGKASKASVNAAKTAPEELGTALKELAASAHAAVRATQDVAANLEDKSQQRNLMTALKATMQVSNDRGEKETMNDLLCVLPPCRHYLH